MMAEFPEDDEAFVELVNNALSDRHSRLMADVRDRLGQPDVVVRTVDAVGRVVDSIDEQIAGSWSEDHRQRAERARVRMLGWLDVYVLAESMRGERAADG